MTCMKPNAQRNTLNRKGHLSMGRYANYAAGLPGVYDGISSRIVRHGAG